MLRVVAIIKKKDKRVLNRKHISWGSAVIGKWPCMVSSDTTPLQHGTMMNALLEAYFGEEAFAFSCWKKKKH